MVWVHSQRIDFSKPIDDFINDHGFDYSYVSPDGIQKPPHLYLENGRFVPIDPAKPADNSTLKNWDGGSYTGANGDGSIRRNNPGIGDVDWDSSQTGLLYSRKTLEFIDDHFANHSEKPFLLYYCSHIALKPSTAPGLHRSISNREAMAHLTRRPEYRFKTLPVTQSKRT